MSTDKHEISYSAFAYMLVILHDLDQVSRIQALSTVIAAVCGEGRDGKNGLPDRKAAMAFYDGRLRQCVVSAFDFIDSIAKLEAQIGADQATKQ